MSDSSDCELPAGMAPSELVNPSHSRSGLSKAFARSAPTVGKHVHTFFSMFYTMFAFLFERTEFSRITQMPTKWQRLCAYVDCFSFGSVKTASTFLPAVAVIAWNSPVVVFKLKFGNR